MSSTTLDTDCPECGGNARVETDHHTGEVNLWCLEPNCGYEESN